MVNDKKIGVSYEDLLTILEFQKQVSVIQNGSVEEEALDLMDLSDEAWEKTISRLNKALEKSK